VRWCVGSWRGSERRIREGGGLSEEGAAERKASDWFKARRGERAADMRATDAAQDGRGPWDWAGEPQEGGVG